MSQAGADDSRVSEADAVLLSAYLDGELSDTERVELERRLERAPALRAELEALRAGGALLRSAGEDAGSAAASGGFAAFGGRLAESAPDEIPIAAALPPPRLRRVLIVLAAAFLGLALLGALGGVYERLVAHRPSGWWLLAWQGTAQVARGERMIALADARGLLRGDVLYLEAPGAADLVGPEGLHASLKGPGTLAFGGDGALDLREGALTVHAADGAAAEHLKLRTPDGEVKPRPAAPFRFTVEVGPRAAAK